MEKTRGIEIEGRAARVMDHGDGPPVVVLHGWGGRIESVAPILQCLRGSFRTVAIDLPGFGASPPPGEVWGTPEYASFVVDLLRELGIDRAHLIGHSFGAKVSFFIAATQPDVVDKMVLVGANGLRMPPSTTARVKRSIAGAARAVGSLGPPGRFVKEAVYSRIGSQDYKDAGPMRPILVRTVNEDFADLLTEVKAPTLLVWGAKDDATPVVQGKRMEALIPDAGMVLFEGAGHFAYLDEPVRFCRVVRHFFGTPL
jgi:pimeloyl-ACP methyl ester carboxylesterase